MYDWAFNQTGASGGGTPSAITCTTESADQTTVTTVGPAITDSSGNLWTITSGAQMAENGTAIAATPPPATGNFSVSGGYLIDPTGAKFIPEGTNVDNYEINNIIQKSNGFPVTTLLPGINYIRVNVCGEGACAINGSVNGGQPTSISYPSTSNYSRLATWCQTNKIACEFEDHTSNGGYWEGSNLSVGNVYSLAPAAGSTLLSSITTFWASFATMCKSNPYCWIGSLNEMASGDNSYSATSMAAISTYELALYNAIRNTGNNNIIDLQAGAGAGHSGTVGSKSGMTMSAYAGMTNVMFFMHYYCGLGSYSVSCSDTAANAQTSLAGTTAANQDGGTGGSGYLGTQTQTTKDGVPPVIYNEWGIASGNATSTDGKNLAVAMTNIQSAGIGSGAFTYFEPSCPSVPTTQACDTQVNNGGTSGLTIGSGSNQYNLTNPWGGYIAAVIAANPYPGGNGPGQTVGETLSVNTIASVAQNTAFTVTGTISGVIAAPTLQYQDNGTGTWTALPSGAVVSTTSFSFSHPGMSSNTAATVAVRDATTTTISAISPAFVVTGAASPSGSNAKQRR
jgi:Cellulase (glycosyl hydrolase family 5)